MPPIPQYRCSFAALILALIQPAFALLAASFPEQVKEVSILSSADGSPQPSLVFLPTDSREAVPLLVGLHSWSGDFRQEASIPMAEWCLEHGWAFIHPNFRGPNWTPEACGSDLAVQDVLDAVRYAERQTTIDSKRIYLLGTSGGGHMSLLMAGRYPDRWAAVSAWVPIFDLSAWYTECQLSGRRYAADLLKVNGAPPHQSLQHAKSYRERSPLGWLYRAEQLPIDINAGIRDGHEGSVPISHALNAFNALATPTDRIEDSDILFFTGNSEVPEPLRDTTLEDKTYGEKRPLFRRQSGKVRITIFDGGHEGLPNAGLQWLAQFSKLAKGND